jgi:hypothetical protein
MGRKFAGIYIHIGELKSQFRSAHQSPVYLNWRIFVDLLLFLNLRWLRRGRRGIHGVRSEFGKDPLRRRRILRHSADTNPSLPILVRTYHGIVALRCQPAIQIQVFDWDSPFQTKKNDRNFWYKFSRQQVSEFCQGTLFFKSLNQPFFFCANFSVRLPGE